MSPWLHAFDFPTVGLIDNFLSNRISIFLGLGQNQINSFYEEEIGKEGKNSVVSGKRVNVANVRFFSQSVLSHSCMCSFLLVLLHASQKKPHFWL